MVNKYFKSDDIQKDHQLLRRSNLSLILIVLMSNATAASFDLNEDWKLETNTNLSFGVNWSTQDPDPFLVYAPDAKKINKHAFGLDLNGDDGRINFEKNDVISQVAKGYTEFRFKGKQQGAVVSAKYWYDHAYETGKGDLKAFDDTVWPRLAKFKGIDLWDAYVWKNFEFEDQKSLNVKLGKHTLSWGKSQFFQNGLNSVSAFDVAAINRPGGTPKERIIPVEMFSFDAALNKNLKVEGFYQFKFRPTVVDGCGTFFAIADFVPENCGPVLIALKPGDKLSENSLKTKSYVTRVGSQKAKDSGQFGFSIKQTLPSLNNAELGFYYANYHNRNATFDGVTVSKPGIDNFSTAEYFSIYPENVDMYGLSLTGKVGKTMLFSELTYKPNQPLQLNGTDIVYYQVLSKDTPFSAPGVSAGLNEYVQGYVRLPVTQFSVGASSTAENILGANNLNWSAELGLNHIANIGNNRIGRSGAFGRSELSTGAYDPETGSNKCVTYGTANLSNDLVDDINKSYCNRDGFFSEWSGGYRLRAALNYNDLYPSTVITPSLNFRHDIYGYSQNFQEGQMSVGAALSVTYQKKYTAEVAYTNYFGSNDFSLLDDRDNISLVLKANF